MPLTDKTYTIREIAEELRFSRQTITRLFEKEPGIVKRASRGKKRSYRQLRIPRVVYERVLRRLTV